MGSIAVEADLRARRLAASVVVSAPADRGSKARNTWLLKQLGTDTPGDLIIESWPRNARTPVTVPLSAAREERDLLESPDGREPLRYRLVLRGEMGTSRKTSGKSPGFVDSVVNLLDRFYGEVVQGITGWVPQAPKLRPRPRSDSEDQREVVDSRADVEVAIDDAVETAQEETTRSAPLLVEPTSEAAGVQPDQSEVPAWLRSL